MFLAQNIMSASSEMGTDKVKKMSDRRHRQSTNNNRDAWQSTVINWQPTPDNKQLPQTATTPDYRNRNPTSNSKQPTGRKHSKTRLEATTHSCLIFYKIEADNKRPTTTDRQRQTDKDRLTRTDRQGQTDNDRPTTTDRQRHTDNDRPTTTDRQRKTNNDRPTTQRQCQTDNGRHYISFIDSPTLLFTNLDKLICDQQPMTENVDWQIPCRISRIDADSTSPIWLQPCAAGAQTPTLFIIGLAVLWFLVLILLEF
jgi:hypothetical protein